jgi:hypothetical protein
MGTSLVTPQAGMQDTIGVHPTPPQPTPQEGWALQPWGGSNRFSLICSLDQDCWLP